MISRSLIALKHRLRNVYDFARMERGGRAVGATGFRPDLLLTGFLSKRAKDYPFSKHPRELFLTDWEMMFRLSKVNGHVPKTQFNNKLFYHLIMRHHGFGEHLPNLIGLLSENGFTSYSRFGSLAEALHEHGQLILKPLEGNGGRGIFLMQKGSEVKVGRPYIVESLLSQHSYSSQIFPGSINTIRLMAMRDVETGRFFVSTAVHRFGNAKTPLVDNFSNGGLCSSIDIGSGVLTAARSARGRTEDETHARHPDTNSPIAGTVVPEWGGIVALAIRAAELIPDLLVIGWDIAVTEKGICLVEGNVGTPGVDLLQAHHPFLADDPRVSRFLAHHGVLSPRRMRRLSSKKPPHA